MPGVVMRLSVRLADRVRNTQRYSPIRPWIEKAISTSGAKLLAALKIKTRRNRPFQVTTRRNRAPDDVMVEAGPAASYASTILCR